MNTFCMTPCGRRKIWDVNPNAGPTPAEKVYTGSLLQSVESMHGRFIRLPGAFSLRNMGFYSPMTLFQDPTMCALMIKGHVP